MQEKAPARKSGGGEWGNGRSRGKFSAAGNIPKTANGTAQFHWLDLIRKLFR